MANMSYCKFKNTYSDLRDCYQNMDEIEELSEHEKVARKNLIKLCEEIVQDYGEDED